MGVQQAHLWFFTDHTDPAVGVRYAPGVPRHTVSVAAVAAVAAVVDG